MKESLRKAIIRILESYGIELLTSDGDDYHYPENVDDNLNFLDDNGDVIDMDSIVIPKFLYKLDKEFVCKDNYDGNNCVGAKGYVSGISTYPTDRGYIYRYRIEFDRNQRVTYTCWYIPEDLLEEVKPDKTKHILEM